jgi:hypothetical protein
MARQRRRRPKQPAQRTPAPVQRLEWTSLPCRRDPLLSAAVGVLVVLLCGVVYLVFRDPALLALSAVILAGSLLTHFLPTRYVLTEESASATGLLWRTQRPWREFRRYVADGHRAVLSPFSQPSRLDGFRGMVLRFEGNREQVLEFVRRRLEEQP